MNDFKSLFAKKNLLWTLGFFSFPFYLFASGGMQISTVFFLLAAINEVMTIKIAQHQRKMYNKITTPLVIFVIYVFFVQLIWAVTIDKSSMMVFAVFYIFNLLVFLALSRRLITDDSFAAFIAIVVTYSVILQTILSVIFRASNWGARDAQFFNNPNQLGYYALLSACILTVTAKRNIAVGLLYVVAMISCVWLAQLSLSKTAILAGGLLLAYGMAHSPKFIVLSLMVVLAVPSSGLFDDRIDAVVGRIDTVGQDNDDSPEGRGYDRIWLHPDMLWAGGGEGAVYRWGSYLADGEMHSTWGTVLFSYGIVGAITMLAFISRLAFSLGFASFFPMFIVVLYGVAHNGIRFLYFWVFLALLAALATRKKAKALLRKKQF